VERESASFPLEHRTVPTQLVPFSTLGFHDAHWSKIIDLSCSLLQGLTIAKVEKLEHGMLHISGVDLVDGTPVLDIKPYLARYDSLPHATGLYTFHSPVMPICLTCLSM